MSQLLKKIPFAVAIASALLIVQCQRAENSAPFARQSDPAPPPQREREAAGVAKAKPDAMPGATTSGENTMSTAAGRLSFADSLRRIARTADLRFRTRDILKATIEIENIVARHGGFFLKNALTNEIMERESWPLNRDSALETVRIQPQNHLEFRVPVTQLDTTLRAMSRLVDHLDHRNVSGQDLWLRDLENELARLRAEAHVENLESAISTGDKLQAKTNVQERMYRTQVEADAAKIEAKRIEDMVRFSTVSVDLYAFETLIQTRVPNTQIAVQPQTPIGVRLIAALERGWILLADILTGLVSLWSIILLGIGLFWGIRKWRKNGLSWRLRPKQA